MSSKTVRLPADFLQHVEDWARRRGLSREQGLMELVERAFKLETIAKARR